MAKVTMKEVDKLIDDIKKNQALVIRRDVATLKRSFEMGKKIGRLRDEPFLTSFLAVCMGAFSGRKRKNLKKFFESQFGPKVMEEVELLIESYYSVDGNDFLMENEIDVMVGFEPVILDTISFVDGLDSPDVHNRLTVAQLNHETQKILGESEEKVVNFDPVKMFANLYSKFIEKLKEFKITSPDKINHFMIKMTEMVQRIQVKRQAVGKEAGVVKPKVKKPSTVKKKAGSPVGMKLHELLAYEDT